MFGNPVQSLSGMLSEAHIIYQSGAWGLRALYARWDIDDDILLAANNDLTNNGIGRDDIVENRTTPPLTDAEKKQLEDKFYFDLASTHIQNLLLIVDPDQQVNLPTNFIDIVKDWIDSDSTVSSGGAESTDYQIEDPAYNAANTLMVNPSEVRLLKDLDDDNYDVLKDNFSTLPEYTLVNVNTADETTLQAIGFTAEAVENIISVRDEQPFETLEDFKDLAVVQVALEDPDGEGDLPPPVFEEALSVKSQYFLLRGEINIGAARLYINSILYRDGAKVTVISRDFSNQQL